MNESSIARCDERCEEDEGEGRRKLATSEVKAPRGREQLENLDLSLSLARSFLNIREKREQADGMEEKRRRRRVKGRRRDNED